MRSIGIKSFWLKVVITKGRRTPNLKNRVDDVTEQAIIEYAIEFPAHERHRASIKVANDGIILTESQVAALH